MSAKPGPRPTTSSFGFVDEVGLLHTPKEDRVFGLGLIKTQHPQVIHREIIKFKNKSKFHEEFKFSNVRNGNLKFYKGLIDIFFDSSFVQFNCFVFDKTLLDIPNFFRNNHYKAYNSFVAMMIAKSLSKSENIIVIADDVSTPKSDNFEKEIKEKIKEKTRRNALFGICRVESHAISELQLVDVILGTVAYAFKIKYKLVKPNNKNAKFRLMKHLQSKLNIDVLSDELDLRLRYGKKFYIEEFKGKNFSKK